MSQTTSIKKSDLDRFMYEGSTPNVHEIRLCSFLVIWSILCSKVSCTDLVRNPAERLFESELAAELLLFRIVDLTRNPP